MIKLFFDSEDALYGMLVGALVLGLAGKFNIPYNKELLIGALVLYVPIILTDTLHEVHDLTRHLFFIGLSLIHNVIDLAITVGFFSMWWNFNVPYVSQYVVPLLQNSETLLFVGYFLIIANFIWLVVYPFTM
jgi:hypothetical protein